MVRENVPAPEGHVCNTSWHDDAMVERIRVHAEKIREAAQDMFSAHRQANVLQYVVRTIYGLPHLTSSDKYGHSITATKHQTEPRDSRHEQLTAPVEIIGITVRAADGEIRTFNANEWDIEVNHL